MNKPKPTTYNSSAIENLEYIEKVVFQLINGNKDDIDRDDIYTSIAWLAEDLGYIYKNGGYMRKKDYLKIVNPDLAAIARNKLIAKKEQLKKEKVVEFKIQWCVDDVRHRLDVEHMTDEEIYEQLDDITDDMHDMAIESGWETMEHCFKIKGENND